MIKNNKITDAIATRIGDTDSAQIIKDADTNDSGDIVFESRVPGYWTDWRCHHKIGKL